MIRIDEPNAVSPAIAKQRERVAEQLRLQSNAAWAALFMAAALGFLGGWQVRRYRMKFEGGVPVKVTDIAGFVDMLAAACEDAGMQGTLEKLLSLPDAQRKELLAQIIQEMRERRAPKDIVDAFICLQDDAIAEKAYEAVYKCPRGVPIAPLQPLRTAA